MERLGASDIVRELQRLSHAQAAAHASKDADQIELADHELALFLRYHAQGRIPEWFAREEEK